MTVFQRTPVLALPMRQETLDNDPAKQEEARKEADDVFSTFRKTCDSFPLDFKATHNYPELSAAEWEKRCNEQYEKGGFRLWVGSTADIFVNPESNRFVYDFWAEKTRARIQDAVKRDLLAPLEPPHPFGTKRVPLEEDYFEMTDRPTVHIVDVNVDPIAEFTPAGIVTESGKQFEFDVIALATGYDMNPGVIKMGVKGIDGVDIEERWKTGPSTFLGITVPGFPNMFISYSTQTPAALHNAPLFIELQVDWMRDMIHKLEEKGIRYVDTLPDASKAWYDESQAIATATLFPKTKSYYNGANIPGGKVEFKFYACPLPVYKQRCFDAIRDEDFAKSYQVCD